MRNRIPLLLGLAAVGASMLAGCSSSQASRYAEYKRNPSPELDTLHERPSDIDNALTVTFDENLRMFTQDWGRFWYVDRPSRLTREPIPRP